MLSVNDWLTAYAAAHEFRISPTDARLVEWRRRLSNDKWRPYGRYINDEKALEIVVELKGIVPR